MGVPNRSRVDIKAKMWYNKCELSHRGGVLWKHYR